MQKLQNSKSAPQIDVPDNSDLKRHIEQLYDQIAQANAAYEQHASQKKATPVAQPAPGEDKEAAMLRQQITDLSLQKEGLRQECDRVFDCIHKLQVAHQRQTQQLLQKLHLLMQQFSQNAQLTAALAAADLRDGPLPPFRPFQ